MKKAFYLLTISLLFMYGCDSQDSDFQDSDFQDSSRMMDNFLIDVPWQSYYIDGNSQFSTSKSIPLKNFQNKLESNVSFRTPSNHANGHFNTQGGNKITFSAGGGNSLGVFNMSGASNVTGIVRCANVDGSQAVIQVVITEIGDVPDGFPIDVGWTVIYLLEDNGEGANAPDDRYFNFVLFAPFDSEVCDGITPADYLSIFEDCVTTCAFTVTAKKSDQIQIN